MYRERIEKWENISKSLYTNRSHHKAIAQKCLKKNNKSPKKGFLNYYTYLILITLILRITRTTESAWVSCMSIFSILIK